MRRASFFIASMLLGALLAPTLALGGAYIFAGEDYGTDIVTHPGDYTGSGTTATVNVCIVPGSPSAASLEVPLQNVIDHYNQLTPSLYNLRMGSDNNLTSGQYDWESTAIHEVGHCIGMAHPNLASESGLSAPTNDSTKSTDGVDNIFNTNSGSDAVYGSGDDSRGDDENLHWYVSGVNNPFIAPDVVDSSNYARSLGQLPLGDSFAANADRTVSGLFGVSNTEAVMQQLTYNDEDQRSLVADEVNTLKFARTGLDRSHGTVDDYTVNLTYGGISSSGCDINVSFNNAETAFAVCSTSGSFINFDNVRITGANVYMNSSAVSWYFTANRVPTPVNDTGTVASGGSMTTVNGGSASLIANDTHPSSALLSLSTTTFGGPEHGSVTLNADGTFSYTHDGGASTSDSFIYRVCMSSDANACSFGRVDIGVATAGYYAVGGTVSGLAGSGLVLQNNGGDDLEITTNGAFSFVTEIADGSTYAVRVSSPPASPDQVCDVDNGSGTVAGAAVDTVSVVCLSVPAGVSASDGTFVDRVEVTWTDTATEEGYEVYRCGNPSVGSCVLIGQTAEDVTTYGDTGADAGGGSHRYRVKACRNSGTCSDFSVYDTGYRALPPPQYTVGGTVSGLTGSGLVLQNNLGDDLSVTNNGGFTFATALDDLSAYSVTVMTQPSTPTQICSVTGGSGNLAGASVTDVAVSCVATCNVNTVSGVIESFTAFHEACEFLVVGPEFLAQDGASVFLSSGWEIEFIPGFTIENGASLSAEVCGQSLCEISPSPMPVGCHSCVVKICDIAPACCDTAYDQACLDKVNTVCGLVCE